MLDWSAAGSAGARGLGDGERCVGGRADVVVCSGDLPFTNVCVDWSLDDAEAKAELPKNGRDHIRARNLAGSGCLLRAGGHRNDGRISVVLTMVGRSELGGWLPSVVVERATYGAYRDILSDGVKALQNAGMDVRFEVHL